MTVKTSILIFSQTALILLATASLLPALLAYFWGEKKPIAAAMNILCIVTGITFGLYLLTLFILTTHKLISTL